MIVICSEGKDRSTSDVIKWLIYRNVDFIRINKEDSIDNITLELSDSHTLEVLYKGKKLTKKSFYWYRRGLFQFEGYKPSMPHCFESLNAYNIERM